MRKPLFLIAGMLALAAATPPGVWAQKPGEKSAEKADRDKSDKSEKGEKPGEKKEEKKDDKKPEEKMVQTKHAIKIGGQEIRYTATAGTILLKLEDGTPKASVFYIAYTKDDVSDLAKRPVTFTFNGGPGSASIWLHLGAFGPASRGDGRRRCAAGASVQAGRQRIFAAGPDRPGIHRPGFDRIQPPGRRRSCAAVSRDPAGH
jgi:hypothetical protein